jgi:hypothetical protein
MTKTTDSLYIKRKIWKGEIKIGNGIGMIDSYGGRECGMKT